MDMVFGQSWKARTKLRGKLYKRTISEDWGIYDPLAVSGGSGFGFNQVIDGSALFIQRLLSK